MRRARFLCAFPKSTQPVMSRFGIELSMSPSRKGSSKGSISDSKARARRASARERPGDLYLEVQLKKDALYRASGKDLYLDLPLAPWEAALGASVKVPTPRGPIMLKIPAGSSQGQELRVKGRGIPAAEPGDLYAVLKIVLPPAEHRQCQKGVRKHGARACIRPSGEVRSVDGK